MVLVRILRESNDNVNFILQARSYPHHSVEYAWRRAFGWVTACDFCLVTFVNPRGVL
jgi:hypothetical protein